MSEALYKEICDNYKSPLTIIALTKYLESNSHNIILNCLKMIENVIKLLNSYYPMPTIQNQFLKHTVIAIRLFEICLGPCSKLLKMHAMKILFTLIKDNSLGIALLCR